MNAAGDTAKKLVQRTPEAQETSKAQETSNGGDNPKQEQSADGTNTIYAKDAPAFDEKTAALEKELMEKDRRDEAVDDEDADNVVVRNVKGKVLFFSIAKGQGFIERADNKRAVFVHIADILQRNSRTQYVLTADQEVEFDVVASWKGPRAASVTEIGGHPVEGTRVIGRFRRGPPRKNGGFKSRDRRVSKNVASEAEDGKQQQERSANSKENTEGDKSSQRKKPYGGNRRRRSFNKNRGGESGGEGDAHDEPQRNKGDQNEQQQQRIKGDYSEPQQQRIKGGDRENATDPMKN